jgi:hypothetical protein
LYDRFGNFAGYSDDEEDIANTKRIRAELGRDLLSLKEARFMTDVPWINPPPLGKGHVWGCAPEDVELTKRWDDWLKWHSQRYRPCLGEIRPAPNGRKRDIFSYRLDHFKIYPENESPIRDYVNNRWISEKEWYFAWMEGRVSELFSPLPTPSSQSQPPSPPPPPPSPIIVSEETNKSGQSRIQELNSVDSHNLQSSEGQLRKPTNIVLVDVIATICLCNDTVNARSDDLLALQTENQPELDLLGKAEVNSRLNEERGSLFEIQKDHPNCSLVRPVNPELPPDSPTLLEFKRRRRAMEEIEHFLDQDRPHFGNFVSSLRSFKPGPDRDEWLAEFFEKVYFRHDFRGDDTFFDERCNSATFYVKLYDQAIADRQGFQEFLEDHSRKEPVYDYDLDKSVSRPFNLGQCRRTSGPSHVVVGGGVALEPTLLCCEKPLGPSRYTGDAPQRRPKYGPHEYSISRSVPKDQKAFEKNLDKAEEEAFRCGPITFPREDRSSPDTDGSAPSQGGSIVGSELPPGSGSADTCVAGRNPSLPDPALFLCGGLQG